MYHKAILYYILVMYNVLYGIVSQTVANFHVDNKGNAQVSMHRCQCADTHAQAADVRQSVCTSGACVPVARCSLSAGNSWKCIGVYAQVSMRRRMCTAHRHLCIDTCAFPIIASM